MNKNYTENDIRTVQEVVSQIFSKADSLQGLQELNGQETKEQRKTRLMMTKFIYKAEFFIEAVWSGTAKMDLLDGEVFEEYSEETKVFKNVSPYLQTFVEFTKHVCIKKLTFNNSNEMFKAFFDYIIEEPSIQNSAFIDKAKLTGKFNQFYGYTDSLTLERNRNEFKKFQSLLISFFIKILNEKTFYHFKMDSFPNNFTMSGGIVSFPHHFRVETGRRISMMTLAKEKFYLIVPENEQEYWLSLATQKILAKEPYYNKTSLQNQEETSPEFEVLPYSTAIEMYVSKHFKPEFSIDYILNLTESSAEDSEAVKYAKKVIRVIWLGRYLENLAIVYMFDQSLIGKDVDVDTINFWRTVFENTHLEISDYLLIILNNNNSCFNEVKNVFHNKNFRQYLIENQNLIENLIENLIILASFKPDRFLEFSREIINTNDIEHFIIDEKFANDFVDVKQKCKLLNENNFSTRIKQGILLDKDVNTIDFWRTVFENTHLEISDYLLIILNNNNSCFNEVKDVFHNKNFRQYLIENQNSIENLIILALFEPDRFLEFSREIINVIDIKIDSVVNRIINDLLSYDIEQKCESVCNDNIDTNKKIIDLLCIYDEQERNIFHTIFSSRILQPFVEKYKSPKELHIVYSLWQETNFLNQYWLMPKITEEDLTALTEILNDDIENKAKIKLIYSLWPSFAEENWFANNKLELDFVCCFKNLSTRQARNIMQKFKAWNVTSNVKEKFVINLKELNPQDLEIVEDLFLENQNFDFIATIIEAKLKYPEIDMQKFKDESFKNEILQDKFFNSAEGIRFLYDFKFGDSEVAKEFLLNSLAAIYENLKSYTAIALSLFGLGAVSSVALITLKLLWEIQEIDNLDLDEIIKGNNLETEYNKISSSLDSENNKNETPILEALREFRTQKR